MDLAPKPVSRAFPATQGLSCYNLLLSCLGESGSEAGTEGGGEQGLRAGGQRACVLMQHTSWVSIAGSLAPAEVTLTPGPVQATIGQDTPLHLGTAAERGQVARGAGRQVSGGSRPPHSPLTFPHPQPVLAQSRCEDAWVLDGAHGTMDKAPNQCFGTSLSHLGV